MVCSAEPAVSFRPVFVYLLKSPSGEVRYVGIARDPELRLKRHLRESKRHKTHKNRWVQSLLAQGLKPIMEVVESTFDWSEAERRWITKLKKEGCRLTNANEGGTDLSHTKVGLRKFKNIKKAMTRAGQSLHWLKKNGSNPHTIAKLEYAIASIRAAMASSTDARIRINRLLGQSCLCR